MMEAASTSETMVNFSHTTWYNNPEDGHLHACHCKNLKSQKVFIDMHCSDFPYTYSA
jgi:hypothetical protein